VSERYHEVKDSCSCGATFEASSFMSAFVTARLTQFHDAHAVCRAPRERPPAPPVRCGMCRGVGRYGTDTWPCVVCGGRGFK
jgi:hypothetical protein